MHEAYRYRMITADEAPSALRRVSVSVQATEPSPTVAKPGLSQEGCSDDSRDHETERISES
jgi:hypothetical protein